MKQNVNEVIKSATKFGVSCIPKFGPAVVSIYETFENMQAKKEAKRLEDSIKEILSRLNELDLKTPIELPYEGEELLFDILKYTQNIYTELKRKCLANLVKNLVHEVERGTFEHRLYRIIFDQFSKLQDPELSLLKLIHENDGSFIYNDYWISKIKLLELSNNSEYCIVQLENTGILLKNTGFASSHPDAAKGEYLITSEAKILANKLFEDCSF